MREITEQEKEVLKASAHLWNEYLKLVVVHPDDLNDVKFHIHAIQNIILSRGHVEQLGIKLL